MGIQSAFRYCCIAIMRRIGNARDSGSGGRVAGLDYIKGGSYSV